MRRTVCCLIVFDVSICILPCCCLRWVVWTLIDCKICLCHVLVPKYVNIFPKCLLKVDNKLWIILFSRIIRIHHATPPIPLYRQWGVVVQPDLHLKIGEVLWNSKQFPTKRMNLVIQWVHSYSNAAEWIIPLVYLEGSLRCVPWTKREGRSLCPATRVEYNALSLKLAIDNAVNGLSKLDHLNHDLTSGDLPCISTVRCCQGVERILLIRVPWWEKCIRVQL